MKVRDYELLDFSHEYSISEVVAYYVIKYRMEKRLYFCLNSFYSSNFLYFIISANIDNKFRNSISFIKKSLCYSIVYGFEMKIILNKYALKASSFQLYSLLPVRTYTSLLLLVFS